VGCGEPQSGEGTLELQAGGSGGASAPPLLLIAPARRLRLPAAGKTAGLRYAGYVTVAEVVRDPATGAATELRCTYDHARTGTAAKVRPCGCCRGAAEGRGGGV